MKTFFLSISLLFCALQLSAQTRIYPSEDGGRTDHSVTISYRGSAISGVCILKRTGDNVAGSIVNEFGVKMLDFTYDIRHEKVQCRNIFGMMDRPYIRKTLKADLQFILSHSAEDGKVETSERIISVEQGGIWSFSNIDVGLGYLFSPITVKGYEVEK